MANRELNRTPSQSKMITVGHRKLRGVSIESNLYLWINGVITDDLNKSFKCSVQFLR
jgi:hypothetical protein